MLIQTFFSEPSVGGFDERIICGLARSNGIGAKKRCERILVVLQYCVAAIIRFSRNHGMKEKVRSPTHSCQSIAQRFIVGSHPVQNALFRGRRRIGSMQLFDLVGQRLRVGEEAFEPRFH